MNRPAQVRESYDPKHFDPIFTAEDGHFWFRARNRCIGAATQLIPNRHSIKDVIEHGCGTGFVLTELQRQFPHANVTGADLFTEGLALARRRFNGQLLKLNILESSLDNSFDLIGLFDVLEHLDDDLKVINALRRQLRPSGRLLITVPAHTWLWSEFDVEAGHRRRYTRKQLEDCLEEGGFAVEYCTEFMLSLVPVMLLRRRIFRGRRRADVKSETTLLEDELRINPFVNRVMEELLRPEALWIRHKRRIPYGTSVLALAIRTE